MASVSAVLAAIGDRQARCEHFAVVARPPVDAETEDVSRISDISVDDDAGEILLVTAQREDVATLSLTEVMSRLSELAEGRADFELEITTGETSLMRIDYPVTGVSIDESQELLVFHWNA